MFSSFLYFIAALIIYAVSDLLNHTPINHNQISPDQLSLNQMNWYRINWDQAGNTQNLLSALLFLIGFALICKVVFKKFRPHADGLTGKIQNYPVHRKISILSVFALIVFAVDIYVLKIRAVFFGLQLFYTLPTLEAALFISFFFLHLIIIWHYSFPVQSRHFAGSVPEKDYILSNIAFSLPAIIPWFALSLLMDILILIPYQPLNKFLNSPAGETSLLLIFIVVLAILGPVLIKKMWKCRPLAPGCIRDRIEELCQMSNVRYADIVEWDMFGGKMLTAGVMGFIGRFRYLLLTPALIALLNDKELEAVVLHENGHVKKFHMLFYILFMLGFTVCDYIYIESLMLILYDAESVYKALSFIGIDSISTGRIGIDRNFVYSVLLTIILVGLFILYFRFVFGFFMRNFERQADLYAFETTRQAEAIISTFRKIAFYSRQPLNKPSWHHYSMKERIDFLRRCEADPSLAENHHRKVKAMIIIFFILLAFILGAGVF